MTNDRGKTELITDWTLDKIAAALAWVGAGHEPVPSEFHMLATRLTTERAKGTSPTHQSNLLQERIKWDIWRMWRTGMWDTPEDVLDTIQREVIDTWRTEYEKERQEIETNARQR